MSLAERLQSAQRQNNTPLPSFWRHLWPTVSKDDPILAGTLAKHVQAYIHDVLLDLRTLHDAIDVYLRTLNDEEQAIEELESEHRLSWQDYSKDVNLLRQQTKRTLPSVLSWLDRYTTTSSSVLAARDVCQRGANIREMGQVSLTAFQPVHELKDVIETAIARLEGAQHSLDDGEASSKQTDMADLFVQRDLGVLAIGFAKAAADAVWWPGASTDGIMAGRVERF